MKTRVKICGLTRREDVAAAVDAGAEALGFVFYAKSPRAVDIAQANELAAAVPPFVSRVGLFLDAEPAYISEVLASVPLDLLQFHGDECPADCGIYQRPYIKAVPMQGKVNLAAYFATYPDAQGFLLDSHASGAAGGTGKAFDWNQIPQDLDRPVILAGGLNPENIARAVATVRPYAVDVSSGVEASPGIKDPQKITFFVSEVQRVSS